MQNQFCKHEGEQSMTGEHGTFVNSAQALEHLRQLGYEKWTMVPLGQSDFLDALAIIATLDTIEPVNLTHIREENRK